MRIVAGRWRGRPLAAPAGRATRPTGDRARQALFDVLAHADWAPAMEGARVIDLFAGSGALGFEALSRGAGSCLFVETDEAARGAIRENADALGALGAIRVHRRDAADLGSRPASAGPAFALAFLDPPYAGDLGARALAGLIEGGWLAPDAVAVFERSRADPDPPLPGWEAADAREWGAARVLFLRRKD